MIETNKIIKIINYTKLINSINTTYHINKK